MNDTIPGRTRWETRDHGHRAAVAAAHRALADLLEADENCPVPPGNDIVVAAAPSVAAVDAFAARHHVTAGWNGRVYKAELRFGPELKLTVIHMPARVLDEHLGAQDGTPATREDAARPPAMAA